MIRRFVVAAFCAFAALTLTATAAAATPAAPAPCIWKCTPMAVSPNAPFCC